MNKKNCYACAIGRLEAQVIPFPLRQSSDLQDLKYMSGHFQNSMFLGNRSCWTLSLLFPKVRGPVGQPPRTIWGPEKDANFSLGLESQETGATFLGKVTEYNENWSLDTIGNSLQFRVPRVRCLVVLQGSLYWALFQIDGAAPALWYNWLFLSPWHSDPKTILGWHIKREIWYLIDHLTSPAPYIDSIGVPRGVPNKLKAQNQIVVGFKSFLFWWSVNRFVY